MIQGYKIRLFPTIEQETKLWEHVNASRFIWNYGLALCEERFKNKEKFLGKLKLRDILCKLKYQEEFSWLKGVSNHTVSNIAFDLYEAYSRFFDIQKQGKKFSDIKIKKFARLNKKLTTYDMLGHPKFKCKDKTESKFPVRQDAVYFKNSFVQIEKIGKIKYQTNYNLLQGRDYKFSNPRIRFEYNKWTLSFGIESENQAEELNDFSMGIDLGIKELAVVAVSDEMIKIKNINKTKRVKVLKHKLKHVSKVISRKYHTNGNYDKSKRIIKLEEIQAKIHYKLSNIRKNHTHQNTHKLVEMKPKRVVMEDLNVSGMMKNRHLSKAIQEQTLYEFIRQMKYKCEKKGIEFVQVDRFYPSSKTCSQCGNIKKDLKLKDRIYKCECGLEIDRDYNASLNLMRFGT
jgi:putative transposase